MKHLKQNKMKYFKITLLLLLTISITNCSSDDDNPTESIDPIIGEWKLIQITENGEQITISDCESLNVIEFLNNGSIKDTYFEPNQNNANDCIEFVDNSGEWQKTTETEYEIKLEDGDLNYTSTTVFSQNNSMHTQTFSIIDGGKNYTYVYNYERIE
ncbi:hypothetical protein A5M85_05145 [Cellulophaga lytica]|uniref:lipocalin family protein n=1 Tax=Cellulophaga lytica TaxID=979 RepID=UPI0009505741|nr:lipocalin family protein [Cellulophaga lytica]APU09690.1 hypothetical protein A5M85_05145 [Cellulophaga lytica]